jgi:hypothetical protein
MQRERLVNAAAFITSEKANGLDGAYDQPNKELTFQRFIASLTSHVKSHLEYEQSELE